MLVFSLLLLLGILIVVAVGVALGIFVGGLLLSLAIFYLKRYVYITLQ